MTHKSVLQKEVIECLEPAPNENFIDATFGLGGHSKDILQRIKPNGKVLGIEIDQELYKRSKINGHLILVNDSYLKLEKIVKQYETKLFDRINGILFDLGMSSWHLEESGRGFSFQRNEVLDMRYDKNGLTAREIINKWQKKDIEKILREYGEERFAGRIAREIVELRRKNPIQTTLQLVEVIQKAIPKKYQRGKHPATRAFQALRIAVNQELENLKKVLPQALRVLEKGGRIVVISFHSLEDRIVKNFFKEAQKKGLIKILTKKPISPSLSEVKENPRSRSAKLRSAIKI